MKLIKGIVSLIMGVLLLNGCTEKSDSHVISSKFPTSSYNEVIAYTYEDYKGGEIILPDSTLNPSVTDQRILNAKELADLLLMLNDTDSYGGDVSRCFIPRLGFVFMDNKIPVAHVSICLQCNFLVSSSNIEGIEKAGRNGFSKLGRKRILDISSSLNMNLNQ
jgi:hypothetical protein